MKRIAALAILMCLPAIALSQGASTAEAGWAKMAKCAAIADDKARHTCTDQTLREAGLLTAETQAAGKRKSFGLQKPAAETAAAAPTRPPRTNSASTSPASTSSPSTNPASPAAATAPAAGTAAPPPKKKQNEQVEVTLAKVQQGADGKLVLTTTDGAVWHQVESATVRPVPAQGQAMTIEARSLGGFMCELGKYVSFRCYRSH